MHAECNADFNHSRNGCLLSAGFTGSAAYDTCIQEKGRDGTVTEKEEKQCQAKQESAGRAAYKRCMKGPTGTLDACMEKVRKMCRSGEGGATRNRP